MSPLKEETALPEGFVEVTLGEVAFEEVMQSGPSEGEEFTYIDIGSIDRESKVIAASKSLPSSGAPSRAKQNLNAGDVIVSLTRPNLNAVAMIPNELDRSIGSTGFQVLRSKWVNPKFLYYLVQTDRFVDEMSALVQGALYPAIRPKDISSFKFLLPSSSHQSRIVAKLEELLSDLDAGVAELKAAQAKLGQYRQSLLKAAVDGSLTAEWRKTHTPQESGAQLLERILDERRNRWEAKQLAKFQEQGKTPPKGWQEQYPHPVSPDITGLPELPDGWAWATVDQLSIVVRGASPRPAGDPRYFGGNIPWITVGSITADEGMFLDSVDQFVTEAGKDASRYLEPGTFLLTNSGATLGVPKISRIGGCINDGSVALLELSDDIKEYLYWYLKTQTLRLRALNQGAAQPNLNTDIVRKICVPLPGMTEMSEVCNRVRLDADVYSMLLIQSKQAERTATAQRKNILKAAFSGQLVPQDPNDEPASVLLERIRAERAAQETKNVKRGRKSKV